MSTNAEPYCRCHRCLNVRGIFSVRPVCELCLRDDCGHAADHRHECRGPRQSSIEDRQTTCSRCRGQFPVTYLRGLCRDCFERQNAPVSDNY